MGDQNGNDHNMDDVNEEDENNQRPLKAMRTNVRAFVSFLNETGRAADVIWLNFNGRRQSYTENGLLPRTRLDMHTFKGHPWITRDKRTGDMLEFIDRGSVREIYFPEVWDGSRNYRAPLVTIKLPVYSLYERSLQVVRQLLRNKDDVDELEIPKHVKFDLGHVQDPLPDRPEDPAE